MALLNGLRGMRFSVELVYNKVKTFAEAMSRAQGAMNVEEYLDPKRDTITGTRRREHLPPTMHYPCPRGRPRGPEQ